MSEESSSPVTLSDRERDTVIAALHLWQLWQDDRISLPFEEATQLEAIADEHGEGLSNDEIDVLIDRKINV